MARTITKESIFKKLEKAEADVARYQNLLNNAITERDKLIAQLDEMRKSEIVDIIDKSGKSIDEIIALLGIQD